MASTTSKPQLDPTTDGRLRRSERSREAIIEALMDLVGSNNLRPTMEQIAEKAGVGIRTVFRHFSDAESLFIEMNSRIEADIAPLLTQEPETGDLTDRVCAFVTLRARVFEKCLPFWRAGSLLVWRSTFIRTNRQAVDDGLREDTKRWIPELESASQDIADAFDFVSSLEVWDRLRTQQGLDVERARQAMEVTALALATRLSA